MAANVRALLVALLVAAASAASAQSGSIVDCAKASSAVERTICGSAELVATDRTLAAAHAALLAKLSGLAKDHLAKDQARWLDQRNRGCATAGADIEDCLRSRYAVRMGRLAAFDKGEYLFVSEQAIIRTGKVKRTGFRIDAAYPQFDGQPGDFTAVNRGFAEAARKDSEAVIPDPAKIDDDFEQEWTYEQSFLLYRPSRRAVAVVIDYQIYNGGAHGYAATRCSLIDLRTAKVVEASDVFLPGDDWLKELIPLVRADLEEQFVDRPGIDSALEADNLGRMLREPGRYLFRDDDVLEIIFNTYEVGSYVAGPYSVEIPYDRLRRLFRPDGPMGN
jgi:uncharacterized protein